MIASILQNNEFLISPNFHYPNTQRSVLVKYRENSIKIATSAVQALTKPKNPNQPINENIFKWIIQACGYALRINDHNNNARSFFQQAMVLYLNWLKEFPFTCENELKEYYIRIMMLHISQIFVNPSFNNTICYIFINKIQSAFPINKKQHYSTETWSVILKVLFYGISELLKLEFLPVENSTKIEFSVITLDLLYRSEVYPNDNFWKQFDEELSQLFKHQLFCIAWIKKFSELYILRLQKLRQKNTSNDEKKYLEFVIQFYKKKIDIEFDEINKQKAFTTIVYSWFLYSKENSSLLQEKWNIEEIKEMTLPWFSINVEWKRDDKMNDMHPLFLLLQMGEGQLFDQKDNKLEEIASQIVRKALSDDSKGDLFWYFPQYSYFFLVKNPDLLDEIKDDFINYVNSFKESQYSSNVKLNIYICFILMLLIEQKKDDQKIVNTLSQLLVSKSNDFTIFLVSLVCLLMIKNSELFWSMYNSSLNIREFDDIADVLSLISCFSPHLNGSDFVNNLSINSNIWNFLYSPKSIFFCERLILSFFFLSEGSDYFVVNPENGASLIQYFVAKNNDTDTYPVLSNFFKMTRLSILCGGALNSSEQAESQSTDTRKPSRFENFITKSYIVSVVNDNFIKIRHGLGSTVFEVDDTNALFNDEDASDRLEYKPIQPEKEANINDESTDYVSKCEQSSELLEAVERMDSLFVSNSDFIPYVPDDRNENSSAAHAFLCDTGFISAFSEGNVKKVPFSVNSIEATLDKLEPSPTIQIPIIQVNNDSVLISKETEALTKLIDVDLKKVTNKVCRIEFIKSNDMKYLMKAVEKYGFCILLNETELLINHTCTDIKANLIISLIPDKNYYIVDLIFAKNLDALEKTAKREIFGKHKIDDVSFIIPNEMLANFICLAALIFYSSSPLEKNENDQEDSTTRDEQVLGPELFVSGYKKRMEAIAKGFEKSTQGKMPLLIEISQET